jgi:hypothetical protein
VKNGHGMFHQAGIFLRPAGGPGVGVGDLGLGRVTFGRGDHPGDHDVIANDNRIGSN